MLEPLRARLRCYQARDAFTKALGRITPKPARISPSAVTMLRTNWSLSAAWLLLATTGMRRGEALGLHWGDVTLDHARLSVRQALVLVGNEPALQAPKTAKGRRSIPLPPETVAALKAHKAAQLQERFALGADYDNSRDLVFRREDGTWVHPASLSRRFETLVRQTSLPEIRLHDLRHTFATLALQANVPVKVVSEILGHASVTITYDTYSHVIRGMAEDATRKVAALVFGRVEPL